MPNHSKRMNLLFFILLMLPALLYTHCAMAELKEFTSKIGIDYSKYGDMAANFQAWETEYLANIEKIIMSKPEKIRERIRWIFSRNWENALNDINNLDWKIIKSYLYLFLEKTPNMVSTWKWLPWYYWLIYERQRLTKERQAIDSVLDKLSR